MKKHRIILIALLFLQSPVYAFGDPKPQVSFLNFTIMKKQEKRLNFILGGLVSGVTWSNTLNNNLGKTTVFCFPSKKSNYC